MPTRYSLNYLHAQVMPKASSWAYFSLVILTHMQWASIDDQVAFTSERPQLIRGCISRNHVITGWVVATELRSESYQALP